jgi:uncharacterized protein YcbK (DUF882 family)
MRLSEHFYVWEFACPCCGVCVVEKSLLAKLDKMREVQGTPYNIRSGCRCPDYNADLRSRGYESVDGSAHTVRVSGDSLLETCQAADIETHGSSDRCAKLRLAFGELGFHRIGIGHTFLHLDVDKLKPPEVAWLYKKP